MLDLQDPQFPKLVISAVDKCEGVYITLSHRWGGAGMIRLISDTFDEFRTNIPLSMLPQTFKDAITVTKHLDVRYLWIDSLCILQDSKDDLRRESARMG